MIAKDQFQLAIRQGIPADLPEPPRWETGVSHAPARANELTPAERCLAVQNALRYFPPEWHATLAPEFASELKTRGRIYMYRFRPTYDMFARHIDWYPGESLEARAIQMMIQNNLDPEVSIFPHELVTYGGNGTVFQNWAQYLLSIKYLATMRPNQTLRMYSGHPLGLFPSGPGEPRVIVTNGMVIPMYASSEDYSRLAALGVTSYGQMTAGSYMYIGPQGIVHGTTITLLNGSRKYLGLTDLDGLNGKLFVSSGLGGMSGAQGKAAQILKIVAVIAEIDPHAMQKRLSQGWIDESSSDLNEVIQKIKAAVSRKQPLSLGYLGNIVDLLEKLAAEKIHVDLASDQTSLNLPYDGGYYPVGMAMEQAREMMANDRGSFIFRVHESLRRQVAAINQLADNGTYFFDYGNAFLLMARQAQADIIGEIDGFRYPSYVRDLMGPICFDYGFGPFRWVCCTNNPEDLARTDSIAAEVIEAMLITAPDQIRQQLEDNHRWVTEAGKNNLVVGSQARILYSNHVGRTEIALAFNAAIRDGRISGPIVLGRDHHDVSGTDSPFRETANIFDGSSQCADMSVHNFAACACNGASWVSLHNGGGVGWGKVINGGFGIVLDGSVEVDKRLVALMSIDVNNGLARRAWAGNPGAKFAIQQSMGVDPLLNTTLPHATDPELVASAVQSTF